MSGWQRIGVVISVFGGDRTRLAAERGLNEFEEDFLEFLQEKFPGLEIKNAPDPRSLN